MSNQIHVKTAGDNAMITVLEGHAYLFAGTNYSLNSINAVIDLVKRKGSLEHTVIFHDEKSVGIILDDSIMDRNQDKAIYQYAYNDDFLEWKNVLGAPFKQKGFVDFLKRRPAAEMDVIEPLLAKVQNLKLATEIMGDYSYDDNNNFTVMFKTKDGEDSTKLPSLITLEMAILNESDFVQPIELELELQKPKSQDEKPTFIVTCPKKDRYIKLATEHEINKLKQALDGYLILAGKRGQ